MRAGLLVGLNEFKVRELEKPVPGPNEVLIKVKTAGICDSDIHKMLNKWEYPLPMVMGHEFAGVVEEVGFSVEKVQPGNRVAAAPLIPCGECPYCQAGRYQFCEDAAMIGSQRYGGFAEYVTVPERNVLKIGWMSFEEAAMIEPSAEAAYGVMSLDVKLGDTVAVFGLGTTGALSVGWLQLAGAKKIIVVDSDQNKLNVAFMHGATDTINPMQESLEERIFELTNGLGVDVVLRCAGSVITDEQCMQVTKKGGRIGFQGSAYSDLMIEQKTVENIFRQEYSIQGFWNSFSPPFPSKAWQHTIDFMNQGRIEVKSLISHRFSLNDLQAAFDLTVQQKESYNKVMIYPGSNP